MRLGVGATLTVAGLVTVAVASTVVAAEAVLRMQAMAKDVVRLRRQVAHSPSTEAAAAMSIAPVSNREAEKVVNEYRHAGLFAGPES